MRDPDFDLAFRSLDKVLIPPFLEHKIKVKKKLSGLKKAGSMKTKIKTRYPLLRSKRASFFSLLTFGAGH
jgi:hypothetical protein